MGEEHIVFNPLSGEIHRLNPMAAAALSELEETPLDLETLVRRMAALMEVEPTDNLRRQLWEMLRKFDEIGLITPFLPLPDSPCRPAPPG